MDKEFVRGFENLAIDQLVNSQWGDKIKKAIKIFEKVQQHLYALSEKAGEEKTTALKVATVATLSIIDIYAKGKSPKEFSQVEWKQIADDISQYVILPDDQKYVEYVFGEYEKYIRAAVDYIEIFASENTVNAIRSLADELHAKTDSLRNGEILEVNYIEDCLWISLEAVIKLIAAMSFRVLETDYAEFVQALSAFAFEYGRFVLYKQEQALVNELIQSQHELDAELEKKYRLFIEDLEKQADYFYVLIDQAFVPDFRETFLNSVRLAHAAGVKFEEVLTTVEEIDSFFVE